MSRAFVKEPDGDQVPDDQPEIPVSGHPNYVTPGGLESLRRRLERSRAALRDVQDSGEGVERRAGEARIRRDLRYLETRVATAIEIAPPDPPPGTVAFGARVSFEDPDGRRLCYRIVGEDEADPPKGSISWVSPLARAAAGAAVGDVVTWERPDGDVDLEISRIEY